MLGLTNSKILANIDISTNEYNKNTTAIKTYTDSFIAVQLRYCRIKCYDENNNLLGSYQATNNDLQIAYFDKKNKHFVKYTDNYSSGVCVEEINLYNVDYVTLQNPESNMYYAFALFY